MKFVDEFRNAELAKQLVKEIREMAEGEKTYKIMEVCGGHTHSIYRHGLKDLLPPQVELIHGPGCPVCVLPAQRTDEAISLARQKGVIFTCFGDLLRIPGARGSLLEAKAQGADVRIVYSPMDALKIARENVGKKVIFFAIGFETTAPSTALTLIQAKREGISNFFVFCNHVSILPPIRTLLEDEDLQIDAFIGPGHLSMVIGCEPYTFIPQEYGKPVVISGFEPLDLLQSIWMILKQFREGRCEVENQYARVVPWHGNRRALAAMEEVFSLRSSFAWRGLGEIDYSGWRLAPAYAAFDAERHFLIETAAVPEEEGIRCGDMLKGKCHPWECPAFGTRCTPEQPLGALMVSSEGACAAYYQYGQHQKKAVSS